MSKFRPKLHIPTGGRKVFRTQAIDRQYVAAAREHEKSKDKQLKFQELAEVEWARHGDTRKFNNYHRQEMSAMERAGKFRERMHDLKIRSERPNPKRSRVGSALRKFVKRELGKKKNPRRTYQVNVPATAKDRGYKIKVPAPSAASAKAAARKYCAKRAGVPVTQFHLPKRTTVKVI